jgi:hypothetical protein
VIRLASLKLSELEIHAVPARFRILKPKHKAIILLAQGEVSLSRVSRQTDDARRAELRDTGCGDDRLDRKLVTLPAGIPDFPAKALVGNECAPKNMHLSVRAEASTALGS